MKNSLFLLLIIGLFAVLSAQTVTVTAPNGGEIFDSGSQTTISWIKAGFTENVKIELYKNNTLQSSIAASAAGTSYNWTVPTNIYGNDFKIKVTSVTAAFINDYSNNYFTISAGTPGTVTVTSPNNGTYNRGSDLNITWSDNFPENVKIELLKSNNVIAKLAESAPSSGSFFWKIPLNLSGTDYRIKISSVDIASVNDISDNDFTIAEGSISMISPTASEVWGLSSLSAIKWNNTISNDPVKIQLFKAGAVHSTIANNAVGTGSFYWTIPANLPKSNDYQIKISSCALTTVSASTDNFSITGTNVTGGNISGTWYPDGSPYVISAKATVQIGNILEIKAGVKVVVMDTLKVKGNLISMGLQNQSVIENNAPITVMNGSVQLQNCLISSYLNGWSKTINGTANEADIAYSIVHTLDGGYAVAGSMSISNGSWDVLVLKLDAAGNQSWVKTFNGTANNSDLAYSIIQTTDGGYAVSGYTYNGVNTEVLVLKLDASGNQSWAKTFNNTENSNDRANSIVQTIDGGYVLTGYTYNNNNNNNDDVLVIKLDSAGNQSWVKTFNGTAVYGGDRAYNIIQTTDGGYGVAGYTYNGSNSDAWIIKLNANGTLSWAKSFSASANSYDNAYSIVQTTDEGYAVAGYTRNSDSDRSDAWVIKLNANGNQSWSKTFNGTGNSIDDPNSIVQTMDGGYAVAGYTGNNSGNVDARVIKLDANGNQSWAKTFNGTANLKDQANSIVQTTDGGYAIAGNTTNSSGTSDIWLLKLNGVGNLSSNKIIMQNANANSFLKNCLFSNSTKSAIFLENSSPVITNCTFSKNNSDKGGAIYATGISTPKITNSIIWGNNSNIGKQIYLDGVTAKPEFRYNLIEGGYTAIGLGNGATLGEVWENNLSTDPFFTNAINFQVAASSPAVNAGTPDITYLNLPAFDLWGYNRVTNGRIDIGCFEFDPADINNNLINDWNLSQNYPNPFNPQTTINYTIKDGFSGLVKLKIYNAKGEVVQTITNNVAKAGHYSQVFNGSNFSSGIYYYGIEAGDFKQMKKMVMVK